MAKVSASPNNPGLYDLAAPRVDDPAQRRLLIDDQFIAAMLKQDLDGPVAPVK